MGFSSLTRHELFWESGNFIENGDGVIKFKDYSSVKNMYYDSARLIRGFEDIINKEEYKESQSGYKTLFKDNAREIKNKDFVQKISYTIEKNIVNKKISNNNSFKVFFKYLLNAIAEYQEEVIKANFIKIEDISHIRFGKNQTFLSYAYYDKGLTQALFYYFWLRSGFLYVNWMWNGVNSNSSITKKILEDELNRSNQLLFLRTINSELRTPGSYNVRQWCSWEIGNFYTKHSDEKYYTSFYDTIEVKNDILDTFKPMKEVVHGAICY